MDLSFRGTVCVVSPCRHGGVMHHGLGGATTRDPGGYGIEGINSVSNRGIEKEDVEKVFHLPGYTIVDGIDGGHCGTLFMDGSLDDSLRDAADTASFGRKSKAVTKASDLGLDHLFLAHPGLGGTGGGFQGAWCVDRGTLDTETLARTPFVGSHGGAFRAFRSCRRTTTNGCGAERLCIIIHFIIIIHIITFVGPHRTFRAHRGVHGLARRDGGCCPKDNPP